MCFQLTHLSSDDCENIFTSYQRHQIGNIARSGLGHKSMIYAVYLATVPY